MIHYFKTNSQDSDFQTLVRELDKDLSIRDGAEHAFYSQFNKIDSIRHVIVAYEEGVPVGCGAIKNYSDDTMEVKRMYVLPEKRGLGIATGILKELEDWAIALAYRKCILETGNKQPEAIALYKKTGYQIIPNYGQYLHAENSICFEKELN